MTRPITTAGRPEFDRRAGQYDRHAAVQREAAAWLAEWLPEKIALPALELGAGTGLFTRYLADRTGRLVASDIAAGMVQTASKAVPGARWVVADAGAPPDGPYGWIFSCSLVQWLPDPAASFHAWHRVASPQARLISGWFVKGTLQEFLAQCPAAAPFVWRDPGEWNEILQEAGWTIHRREVRTFRRHHPDAAAMLRELHGSGAVVPRRIGAGELRQAMRRFNRDHRDERGVPSTFRFIRVEAVRS